MIFGIKEKSIILTLTMYCWLLLQIYPCYLRLVRVTHIYIYIYIYYSLRELAHWMCLLERRTQFKMFYLHPVQSIVSCSLSSCFVPSRRLWSWPAWSILTWCVYWVCVWAPPFSWLLSSCPTAVCWTTCMSTKTTSAPNYCSTGVFRSPR